MVEDRRTKSLQHAMADNEERILNLCLRVLNFLGLDPYKKTRLWQTVFMTLSLLFFGILIVILAVTEDFNFALFSDIMESTVTVSHGASKFLGLWFKKGDIKALIHKSRLFWKPSDKNTQNEKEVSKALDRIHFVNKSLLIYVTVAIAAFGIQPFLTHDLVISCYMPDFYPWILFVCHNNLTLALSMISAVAVDITVCAFLGLLYVQFKRLNAEIASCDLARVVTKEDEDLCLRQLRRCIDHHNFLYGFLNDIQVATGGTFFAFLAIVPVTVCFEIFFVSKTENVAESLKSVMYVCGVLSELLFFFCIPSTAVTMECDKMMLTIYKTDWYKCPSIAVRKHLVSMMQRLQQDAVFRVGKVFPINMEMFASVYKLALSFYTFLNVITTK